VRAHVRARVRAHVRARVRAHVRARVRAHVRARVRARVCARQLITTHLIESNGSEWKLISVHRPSTHSYPLTNRDLHPKP